MAASTSIEWAANADGTPGATWNPIRASYSFPAEFEDPAARPGEVITRIGTHCVHASEGCRFCYAETFNLRKLPGAGTGLPYTKQAESLVRIFLDERMLAAPLRRRKPTTWFLSSMTDVFADFVTDAMLDKLFAVMALSPQHTFIVLTKRAARMREFVTTHDRQSMNGKIYSFLGSPIGSKVKHGGNWKCEWPLPNVCLGVSAEDQATADERTPHLLATPARWRAVSAEPLLGAIMLDRRHMDGDETYWDFLRGERGATLQHAAIRPEKTAGLDWVICGGESGRDARPLSIHWVRELRDQCKAAGVPFFWKQWGEWAPAGVKPSGTPGRFAFGDYEHDRSMRAVVDQYPRQFTLFRARCVMERVGKAKAGRLLDGVEHNARPDFFSREGEARLLATTTSPGRPA